MVKNYKELLLESYWVRTPSPRALSCAKMRAGRPRRRRPPPPAHPGDRRRFDELDGDYDLAGRDSNDVDEGYVHRVRPRRTSHMSISVQGCPRLNERRRRPTPW